MKVKFYELAIGAEFTAPGKRHRKIAMSMAEWVDAEDGWGSWSVRA